MNAFVIGAPRSGAGKTMVSLGLMRALRESGVVVAPFKSGPDYIDTQFHAVACGGRGSVNLDLFMGSPEHVAEMWRLGCKGCEVAVIEGAMGLFDGYKGMAGSAADVARCVGVPVVLVVDASSMAFSAGALLYGFAHFRDDVRVAGVIFNRVASARHRELLAEAAREAGVECLGWIGRHEGLETPSRHLGLTLTGRNEMERFVSAAADAVREGVDIERLLEVTRVDDFQPQESAITTTDSRFRVAVARDEAFNFIYEANLHSLRCRGAEIVYFSPLRSQQLPQNVEMVYLPGGYPELWAKDLEDNEKMRRDILAFGARGGRILAECGGLIYLGREIDGHAMCGLLPTEATMDGARLTLGYRIVELDGGMTLRGHEFHYSRLKNPGALPPVATQRDARGREVSTPLYRLGNTLAGYTHLYWGETDIMNLWK